MDISVIIPTYNRRDTVRYSLETLFAQKFPASRFEIIVVIDGSTDGTAALLRELQPRRPFRVIEQENRGPSGARNAGYRAAASGLVLFLDDDMRCDSDLVAAHVAAHADSGSIIAFGSLFLSEDSRPSLAAECFRREIGAFHLRNKRTPEAKWQVTDCTFANASIPKALLENAGGFDESFRRREDLELGVRLIAAGAHPTYVKNAIAFQHYEKTCADLIHDAEGFAAADVMFARKHPNIQVQGQLNSPNSDPRWKQSVRRIAAVWPPAADIILAPACGLGEVFFVIPVLRRIGVRALQIRRRIHWLHKVLELEGQFPEAGKEKAI
jgi:glycosyltransferase involved in cell wall biosynthesis